MLWREVWRWLQALYATGTKNDSPVGDHTVVAPSAEGLKMAVNMTRAGCPLILFVAGLAYSGDEDIVKLLRLVLDKEGFEADFQVVPVADVMETAQSQNPALIIIGHRPLPVGPSCTLGATVVKALKADPQTRRIPVLLLEALVDIEYVARECGADAYLSLPTFPKEFVDTVSRLTQGGQDIA